MQKVRAFIGQYRGDYGVEPICRVLQVAPSGYRHALACLRHPELRSRRAKREEELLPLIQSVWEESWQVYGAIKVWHQLRRQGVQVARCTVERLMRAQGWQEVRRGKRQRTTVPDQRNPCPQDLVHRDFRADRPNQLWEGWIYVAFIIDTFARKIVGWQTSTTMHADFVLDALEQALHARPPVSGDSQWAL